MGEDDRKAIAPVRAPDRFSVAGGETRRRSESRRGSHACGVALGAPPDRIGTPACSATSRGSCLGNVLGRRQVERRRGEDGVDNMDDAVAGADVDRDQTGTAVERYAGVVGGDGDRTAG